MREWEFGHGNSQEYYTRGERLEEKIMEDKGYLVN